MSNLSQEIDRLQINIEELKLHNKKLTALLKESADVDEARMED